MAHGLSVGPPRNSADSVTHSDWLRALACIDWQQPWLEIWRALGVPTQAHCADGADVAAALNRSRAACAAAQPGFEAPVFVDHAQLPADLAYETFIFETRQVPCRNNVHDFFNGLAWLVFPQLKARLNALQASEIRTRTIGATRGPVRDAITVFDENAGLWCGPDETWAALRRHDWHTALLDHRAAWLPRPPGSHSADQNAPPSPGSAHLVIFGHALLEKLIAPRKPLVVHCFRHSVATNSIVDLDTQVSRTLCAELLAAKPFQPVPVLGVPGWWPANARPEFYDDASVFRPKRSN